MFLCVYDKGVWGWTLEIFEPQALLLSLDASLPPQQVAEGGLSKQRKKAALGRAARGWWGATQTSTHGPVAQRAGGPARGPPCNDSVGGCQPASSWGQKGN